LCDSLYTVRNVNTNRRHGVLLTKCTAHREPVPSLFNRIAMDVQGDGPSLVLVHGVATSRSVWRHVVPDLAKRHRVVTLDLPGFGASPPTGRGFVLEEVADALADGLAGVPRPFDLLGNSLGGAVSLVMAERRPELVRRLILAAPAGMVPHRAPVPAVAGGVTPVLVTARRYAGPPLARSALARRLLIGNIVADPVGTPAGEARTLMRASAGSKRIGAAIATVAAVDLRPRLARLDVPLAFLWGVRDRVFPIAILPGLRSLVPDARAEVIARAGHVPQIDRPADFVAAVERLITLP
jgi:pimeloyl-ACP methyl ester carboxylesterase